MSDRTLIDVLAWQAESQGAQTACTFLEEGETAAATYTFNDLYRRARAIAAELQDRSAIGERALLVYPIGLDFLAAYLGCVFAGVIAIPAPAPEPGRLKRAAPRLRAILDDAAASLILTTSQLRKTIDPAQLPMFSGEAIPWIDTDLIVDERARDWRRPDISARHLAFLQYTSGSTAAPRGVMVSHRNLVEHLGHLQAMCGYTPDSTTVTWMPYYHDYGLIEGLLEPMYNGTPVVLMAPLAFVKRPGRWLRAITKYRATHSQGPNFGYDQCVRRVSEAERSELDLSCWRAAGVAAEPVNPRVLRAFQQKFGPSGFEWGAMCPAFGLAEATLLVSFTPQGQSPTIRRFDAAGLENRRVSESTEDGHPARELVACGRTYGATQVAIVDPRTRVKCPPDAIGEIWVCDRTVAEGYWRRPGETFDTFNARLAPTGEGPFLRTGDLGFLRDGELYIAGRLKDVIIVRGVNHYPQELEWTMQGAHSALRPENGAAFSIMVDNEEKLALAQELEYELAPEDDGRAIIEAIRTAIVAEHDIDPFAVLLLRKGTLPKTTSGKVQRSACRNGLAGNSLDCVRAWFSSTSDARRSSQQETASLVQMPSDTQGSAPVSESNDSARRAGELIGWLREYAGSRINSRLMDERRCIPPYVILDFGNHGVMGMQVPTRYGGLGLRFVDTARVFEQLAAVDYTLATVVYLNNANGIRPILKFATEALRDELVPRLAQGRELAAFGLSEPGAGSSLGGLSTRAIAVADGGWRLTGVKRWNASSWAGVTNVFARLVGSDGRLGGLTGFVVRQGARGLRIGPEALTMGLRGSVQNSLHLDNVFVGSECLLGRVQDGMTVAEDALRVSRWCTAVVSVGAMKRCAQLMVRYAGRRQVNTGRLGDNPLTLARLGTARMRVRAGESLTGLIAARLDQEKDCPGELSMIAKVLATDFLNDTASDTMQLLGGRGYMENNLVPQLLRDARALSIGEGPNEGLTMHIGRSEQQTQLISQYLEVEMQAPLLAASLRSVAAEIVARCRTLTQFTDETTRAQWGHILTGQVAIDAVALASLELDCSGSHARADRQVREWAQARFDLTSDQAVQGVTSELTVQNFDEAVEIVAGYQTNIGDIEQDLAGEDQSTDPLLVRSATVPEVERERGAARLPPHSDAPLRGSINAEPSLAAKRETLKAMLRSRK